MVKGEVQCLDWGAFLKESLIAPFDLMVAGMECVGLQTLLGCFVDFFISYVADVDL